MKRSTIIIIIVLVAVLGVIGFLGAEEFPLPEGETRVLEENDKQATSSPSETDTKTPNNNQNNNEKIDMENSIFLERSPSDRQILETDGTKHSIPLDEILSGGPGKDGIPSIDNPVFVSANDALDNISLDAPGIAVDIEGEARFYPYQILVWHEIVNDTVQDVPILVTYCPLCATGIVFERRVDREVQEFGVSGRLWQSNLLMYNRAGDENTESLWSQVLGEAVVGPETGERLRIVPSTITKFEDWLETHPDTKVLSQDTGAVRPYGRDPYGSYYTDESVSFGATFNDDRLHPKAFVLGVEINGQFKAYHEDALPVGETTDTFAGKNIVITKNADGEIQISADGEPLPFIPGFWFSWLAVHPDTELFK